MKYLFVINSHITTLSAKAVIAHENIPHEDVIILTMRGAGIKDIDLKHVEFIYPHIVNPVPQTRNIFKSWKVLNEFDRFIDKITGGEKFYCYVNHNMARNTELMVNHPFCTGFSILEEGGAAYNTMDFFDKKYSRKRPSFWDLLGYRNRIRRRYFYRPDYDKVYAVTPKAFPGFRNKVVLKDVFSSDNIAYKEFDKARIIVFDGIIISGLIDMESFLIGMRKFIALSFTKNEDSIYYRFHPAQPPEERKRISDVLSCYDINFVQLPDEIVLEELIMVAKNLTMYFNFSTISIYANMLGHKCYSFSEILAGVSADYKKKIENLNATLKESSIQING
ncbi:MAG: hypothetical protein H0V30_12215 [Chitinophagaceae bacterium]|nr:hypothetical protein [Chitinophagaceae bacterium]